MARSESVQQRLRVLFFGMQGNFSSPALAHLLQSDVEVCAVVVPASPVPGVKQPAILRRDPPRASRVAVPLLNTQVHPSIIQTAWARHIPLWEVQRLSNPEALATLASYQPDIICVACFSLILPRAVLDLPRLGCLNVHPALLPANRGPVPLFWTFREGQDHTGVTIHFMSEKMDSGAILAQEALPVPDGIRYEQLETRAANLGGRLLVRAVRDLYEGRAAPVPQDEASSSYHSFPTDDDFVVPAHEWSARHVYNFIRGISHWGNPIDLRVATHSFLVQDATSYSHETLAGDNAYEQRGDELAVRCKTGWVQVMPVG